MLDESDDRSNCSTNCSTDFSAKIPINALSRRQRSSRLLHPVDQQTLRKSYQYFEQSELSLSSSVDSVAVDEIDELTSNLSLGYDQQSQLLQRCGQTEPLPFNEVYSAR